MEQVVLINLLQRHVFLKFWGVLEGDVFVKTFKTIVVIVRTII